MSIHPRHGIHAPTVSTPARAPGSLRRTATTDMLRPDGLLGELVLMGRARDLWTDAAGKPRVLGESGYEARVAYLPLREITQIRCEPSLPAAEKIVGTRATSGFRAALDGALPEQRDARSLLYLLLDDLPVTALVSGYAMSFGIRLPMATAASPRDAGARSEPQASGVTTVASVPGHASSPSPNPARTLSLQHPDLCAGWRTGGTILVEMEETGRVPVVTGPEAPPLAREGDALAWHALPPIPPNGMRRHRRLDLRLGDELEVDALFRDSHVAPDGRETIVHEYSVAAAVDPEALVFTRIEATARALPWIECNPAAASAARLVGRRVAGLRPRVRAEFTGTTTCTHLNDTLRSLEDIEALAPVAARLSSL